MITLRDQPTYASAGFRVGVYSGRIGIWKCRFLVGKKTRESYKKNF